MNCKIKSNLLKIIGELIFEERSKIWRRLSIVEQREILSLVDIIDPQVKMLVYYYLHQDLPEDKRSEYWSCFLQHNASIQQEYLPILQDLQEKLVAKNIDYILLKGIYLGINVYPHAVLRVRGDIDLLVHPKDAVTLQEELRASGGHFFGSMRTELKHLPPVHWQGKNIEIHTHLFSKSPNLCQADLLWKYAKKTTYANQYELTPEFTWLMRICNVYEDHYAGILRMLLDLAFIQKKFKLDPEKLKCILNDLKLDVDLRFPYYAQALWPSSEVLFPANSENVLSFNKMLWDTKPPSNSENRQFFLNEYFNKQSGASKINIFCRKIFLKPMTIIAMYRIPPQRYWQLPYFYLLNFINKSHALIKYLKTAKSHKTLRKINTRKTMDSLFRPSKRHK